LRHFDSKQTTIDNFWVPFHLNFKKGTYFFILQYILFVVHVSVHSLQYVKEIFFTEKEMIDGTHIQIQASFYRGAHVREQARLSFEIVEFPSTPRFAILMLFNNYIWNVTIIDIIKSLM